MVAGTDTTALQLLRAAVRLNTLLFGTVCGVTAGAVLCLSTFVLLAKGGSDIGQHQSLLSIFLPGYSMSTVGAWAGFAWGFALGGIFGGLIYWTYARTITPDIASEVKESRASDLVAQTPVAHINGSALGIALGAVMAVQLLITTNWLVLRGTGHESEHAALLSNYLAGYSVTHVGSVIGAMEVFGITYVACVLLGTIYNRIIATREPA